MRKVNFTHNKEVRNLGEYSDDYKTFYTYRNIDEHLLRMFNALGISKQLLDQLIFYDVERIVVRFDIKGRIKLLETTPTNWKHKGQIHSFGKFEEQTFLALTEFEDKGKEEAIA